jgi:hypothetical protein
MVVTKDEIKCTVTAGLTQPTPRIENLVSVSVRLGYFHGELKPSVDAAMLIQSDQP